MPFYIRKSISAGPFRFNFSKGGVGVSIGVKGFRIGTGPRGHYVHAGGGGLYYRASLNDEKGRHQSRTLNNNHPPTEVEKEPGHYSSSEPSVYMVPVSSGDVMKMQDERFADLLDELNAKKQAVPFAWIMGFSGFLIGTVTALMTSIVSLVPFLLGGVLIGIWLDSYKRCVVVFYELQDDAKRAYEELVGAFDAIASCAEKWRIDSGGVIRDIHAWKRNAGASHLVDRHRAGFSYAIPRFLKTNVTPPAIKTGKEAIYFLPDVVLVVENGTVGAIPYEKLNIRWEDGPFIESESVPSDAVITGYTWAHPNKNGGPDRRFANNRQIPVCVYETLQLTSSNGLNELLQLSKTGLAQPFFSAVLSLAKSTGPMKQPLKLSST